MSELLTPLALYTVLYNISMNQKGTKKENNAHGHH